MHSSREAENAPDLNKETASKQRQTGKRMVMMIVLKAELYSQGKTEEGQRHFISKQDQICVSDGDKNAFTKRKLLVEHRLSHHRLLVLPSHSQGSLLTI